MYSHLYSHCLTVLLLLFVSHQVMAGGFEKNVMWSGRYSGQAGAAVSSVQGSESIYFNPAGLMGEGGKQIAVNISPTFSQYEAPVVSDNSSLSSEKGFGPIFGLTYKHPLNEQWSLGAGYYVGGGTDVEYANVTLPADFGKKPTFKSSISLTELALGAGYKVNEQLKLGLAWRIAFVDAEFNAGQVIGAKLATNDFTGLKAIEFTGFKLGAIYTPNETWGLGLVYRSAISFMAEGDFKTTVRNVGGAIDPGYPINGDAEIESEFPQQIILGGHYKLNDQWTAFAEYVWTNYGAIDEFVFDTGGGNETVVDAGWEDQHNIRLAGEYRGWEVPLRLGYVFTTAAVPEKYANPTFSTPGIAHTLTVGSGYGLMDGTFQLDGAFEYSFATGEVGNGSTETKAGDYSSEAIAVHLGATYSF